MKKTATRRSTETPLQAPQSTQTASHETTTHTQSDRAAYNVAEASPTQVAFNFQQVPLSAPTSQTVSATRVATHAISPLPIQRKRVLGPAHDAYEQEADVVATQVVAQLGQSTATEQGPTSTHEAQQNSTPPVLRKVSSTASLSSNESSPISDEVEGNIQSSLGSGSHLPGGLQSRMEGAFGADFSNVRIHANSDADNLNSSLGARAFTVGQDVYFGRGEYQPTSGAGQHLLAHELTHVVQQNGSLQSPSSASTEVSAAHAGQVPTGSVVQTARGTTAAKAIPFGMGEQAKENVFGNDNDRKSIAISTNGVNNDQTKSYTAQDISITAADVGENDDTFALKGRKYTPKNLNGSGAGQAVILFSGSGGSNEDQLEPAAAFYCRQGSEAFAVNYRGFGKSANKDNQGQKLDLEVTDISEEGMVKDASRVFTYVNKTYSDGNILLHGYSLGGAIAAKLTKRLAKDGKKLRGLVLHSSIETTYKAAKDELKATNADLNTKDEDKVSAALIPGMALGAKLAVGSFDTPESLEEIAKVDPDLPIHYMSGNFAQGDQLALSHTRLMNTANTKLQNTSSAESLGGHLDTDKHLQDQTQQNVLATLLNQGRMRKQTGLTAVAAQ